MRKRGNERGEREGAEERGERETEREEKGELERLMKKIVGVNLCFNKQALHTSNSKKPHLITNESKKQTLI